MTFVWQQFHSAVSQIFGGNPYLWQTIGFTLLLTAMATGTAIVIGVPLGLFLGIVRRGTSVLRVLVNAGMALPPVIVAAALFLLSVNQGPLAGLNLFHTKQGIYVGQTILALPYVIALTAGAAQSLPAGLLDQARRLGAGPGQIAGLALSEARRGVITAVIAAVASCLSEVSVMAILGGNIYGYDQTLASGSLYETNGGHYADAIALALVLGVLTVILMGALGILQQTSDGLGLKLRATATGAD